MPGMDTVSMVILAISALALLEVAAANLRGEERVHRVRRTPARR
jgi:Tfp pilus assembly protein PilV